MPAVIIRWTLAGTLLGVASAIALWLARAPAEGGVRPTAETRGATAPSDVDDGSSATPTDSAVASSGGRRAFDTARTAGTDPDFGVLAYGRVTDEEGTPVADAPVVFEDGQAHLFRATARPDGGWALHGLAPGPHELRVTKAGFLPLTLEVDVPAERGWRRDVRLERALSLPVRFEDADGEALEMGRFDRDKLARLLGVVATREAPGARIPGVRGRVASHSKAGRFLSRAEGQAPSDLGPRHQGLLRLTAAPPLWVSAVLRDVVLETRSISGSEGELVFVIEEAALEAIRGEVRVRVVGRDGGQPITAGVKLEHPAGGVHTKARIDGGSLVFEKVPPGSMDLVYWGPEGERLERSVDVPPGGVVDLGTIVLGRPQSFRVRIVDEAGAPLAEDVGLSAARPELVSGPGDLNQRWGIRVSAQGVAEIRHLAAGPTLLRAGGRGGRALVARMVDTSRETNVELVVPRGTPVVLRRGRKARPGVVYVLEDARGLMLSGGTRFARDLFLQPGRYVLRAIDGPTEIERVEFTVGQERLVVRYGGDD